MIKHIKYFCYFCLLWSFLLVGFNFYIDPIQFYRKAENPYFTKNQRYQIPGLIKHYPFDTIFIGTSLSENFLSSHLDNGMGTKSINLAISGSSAKEQSQVVKTALASGKVKKIIWELNYKSFLGEQPNLVKGGAFPVHLYNNDFLAGFYYLYSIDTLWMSIKKIIHKGGAGNLEKLSFWGDEKRALFDGIHVINHYCSIKDQKENGRYALVYKDNIKNSMEKLIRKNNDTHFYLFIPPISILNFQVGNNRDIFSNFRRQIYKLARYSNVTIYDFMTSYDIISDYNNYKDVMHFSPAISDQILENIAGKKYDKKLLNFNDANRELDMYLEQNKGNLPDCTVYVGKKGN